MEINWISAKDRLPEKEGQILLFCPFFAKNEYQIARKISSEKGFCIVGGWENCYYCGGENRVVFDPKQQSYTHVLATHWAMIPEEFYYLKTNKNST